MAQQEIQHPKAGADQRPAPPPAANNAAAQEIQRQQAEAQRRAALQQQQPQHIEIERRAAAPQVQQHPEAVAPAFAQRQRAEELQREQAAAALRQRQLEQQQQEAHTRVPPGQPIVNPGRVVSPVETGTPQQHRWPPNGGTEVRHPVTGQTTGQPIEQHYPNQGANQGQHRPYYGSQPVYNNITVVNNNNIEPFRGDWHHRHGFDPDRGRGVFAPVILFNPGESWGWRDREGWDPNCFRPQFDPNYENWAPSIHQEAGMITDLLNRGDTVNAAQYLNVDLFNMRGDVYAQNELLSEIRQEQSGYGATLYLGDGWNPDRGTWNTVEVVSPEPPPGYQPAPSYFLHVYDDPPTDY